MKALWSKRACRYIALSAVTAVFLASLGQLSAFTSQPTCERATQYAIITSIATKDAPSIMWIDESRLYPIPWPKEMYGGCRDDRASTVQQWLFSPAIAYRAPKTSNGASISPPQARYAWAYVHVRCPMPFLARSHYGYGDGFLQRTMPLPEYSGSQSEGVITYVCFFGYAIPINRWGMGFIYCNP
jgi:hypothetical protein